MDGMTGPPPGGEREGHCPACARPLWQGDHLTGLADRLEFRARLEEALSPNQTGDRSAREKRREVVVLLVDLDTEIERRPLHLRQLDRPAHQRRQRPRRALRRARAAVAERLLDELTENARAQ